MRRSDEERRAERHGGTAQTGECRGRETHRRRWTLTELIDEAHLPYCRRKCKESTAGTTEDRIRYHLVRDLGKLEIRNITRDMLQRYLEKKTKSGLSHSVVHHPRWDLRAIFGFAHQDGLVDLNVGESLFTPGPKSRDVLTAEQIQQILTALPLREELVVRLAIHSGMRPGEIIALQWKHVQTDHRLPMQARTRKPAVQPQSRSRPVAVSGRILKSYDDLKRIGNGGLRNIRTGEEWLKTMSQRDRISSLDRQSGLRKEPVFEQSRLIVISIQLDSENPKQLQTFLRPKVP